MKTTTAAITFALLSSTVLCQNMPWEFRHGGKTSSGIGSEHCQQEIFKLNDIYAFQVWPALPAPNNNAPQPWVAPTLPSLGCNIFQTPSKDWERGDQECETRFKDSKKQKEQCYDRLEKDKKNDKSKADDCFKARQDQCNGIQDARAKDDCWRRLGSEKAGYPLAPAVPQQPQQVKAQTKCCLRLFADRNCKQKVFETCNPGQGNAQSDVPSWNIMCS